MYLNVVIFCSVLAALYFLMSWNKNISAMYFKDWWCIVKRKTTLKDKKNKTFDERKETLRLNDERFFLTDDFVISLALILIYSSLVKWIYVSVVFTNVVAFAELISVLIAGAFAVWKRSFLEKSPLIFVDALLLLTMIHCVIFFGTFMPLTILGYSISGSFVGFILFSLVFYLTIGKLIEKSIRMAKTKLGLE